MELEGPALGPGRLIMQLNKADAVEIVDRFALELGEPVDRLHDPAVGMGTEDAVIWVYGTEELEVLAFTKSGGQNLHETIAMERDSLD